MARTGLRHVTAVHWHRETVTYAIQDAQPL
jgi:hypothetical protein